MENLRDTFRRNFRYLIESKNVKQAQLAREMGISAATVQRWLNGDVWPTDSNITHLARILEINPQEFFQVNIVNSVIDMAEIKTLVLAKLDELPATIRSAVSGGTDSNIGLNGLPSETIRLFNQVKNKDLVMKAIAEQIEWQLEAEQENSELDHQKDLG